MGLYSVMVVQIWQNRVFADVIEMKVLRSDDPGAGGALNPTISARSGRGDWASDPDRRCAGRG